MEQGTDVIGYNSVTNGLFYLCFTICFCFSMVHNHTYSISISYIVNRYRFPFPSSRFGEWTNQTLKSDVSLDWYQEGWVNNLKVIIFAHNSSMQASTEYRREPQLLTEVNNAIVHTVIAFTHL
jgi:hypothetical protein